MPLMLPPAPASARSVVGVAGDLLAGLRLPGLTVPIARSSVLIVIDGLGALALRAHAGHARTLSRAMGKKDVARSVFPTTTAAALTSLLTGVWPGEHGLIGYRVRHPESGVLFNQLTEWQHSGIDPETWQAAPTIFERASSRGNPAFALGLAKYRDSGFSRAVLRGAQFITEASPAERVRHAFALAADHEGALVYCYLPELDKAGHAHGVKSAQWVSTLETIDAALATPVPAGVGVLVTSDHGMIDVPAHRHILIDPADSCMQGVQRIGGEPRMLHVYLDEGVDAAAAAARWQQSLAAAAQVASRDEAIEAGLFGPVVTPDAAQRIGEVLLIARGTHAIYAANDITGRGMVGQHGALTPEEQLVPLIRLGAFAD